MVARAVHGTDFLASARSRTDESTRSVPRSSNRPLEFPVATRSLSICRAGSSLNKQTAGEACFRLQRVMLQTPQHALDHQPQFTEFPGLRGELVGDTPQIPVQKDS